MRSRRHTRRGLKSESLALAGKFPPSSIMPTRVCLSGSESYKLKQTVHSRVSEAPLEPSTTGSKEKHHPESLEASGQVFARAVSAGPLPSRIANLDGNQRGPTIPSSRTSTKPISSSKPHHGLSYRHRSKPKSEDIPYRRHSSEPVGSLKRETSSPTRRPTSAPHYSAPGSTSQLAKFCEAERVRFQSDKYAKLEEPLKWTAQPVPRHLLGLSMVFAVVLSFISRLWSALVLFCRTGLEKLDIVVISMPSVPETPSPIAHSGNGTPMRKYPVQRDKVFKQASRAGSPQSDLSSSSALDQVVIAYLTDRLSSASPSALDQVVLDYLTQQALHKCAGLIKR